MGEHEDDRLLDDSKGFTKSDLDWLRRARIVMTPDTLEWMMQTKQVITPEMLAKIKKQDERNTAFGVFLVIGGSLMGAIGFDKVVKIGKSILEILGGGK